MIFIKKFRVFFISLILSFVLCLSCFATSGLETVSFLDHFRLTNISIQNVSSASYNTSVSNVEGDIFSSCTFTNSDVNYKSWALGIATAKSKFDSSRVNLKQGDCVYFDMSFQLQGLAYTRDVFKYVKFYIYNGGSIFDYSSNISCGTTSVSNPTGSDPTIDISLSCNFVNNVGKDLNNVLFVVYFELYPDVDVSSRSFVNVFFDTVSNFYIGDPKSNPYLPSSQDPNDTIGNDINDYKTAEDNLNNDTSQGREDTLNFFNSFSDVVLPFSMSLLAISQVFNYLIGNTVFESILYVSITLGLVMLILNIVPSIINRHNSNRSISNRSKGG